MPLKCSRCRGEISKGMYPEVLNGKTYHLYCAEAIRRPRFNLDRTDILWSWWPRLLFSFWQS